MDSEDEMAAALDENGREPIDRWRWLNAENTRRRISGERQVSTRDQFVLDKFAQIAEINAKRAAGISTEPEATDEAGQIEFHLPAAGAIPESTFEFDTYKMVCQLLNQLEAMGENLLAYGDENGLTELGGENHTLRYDNDLGKWTIQPGRSVQESA